MFKRVLSLFGEGRRPEVTRLGEIKESRAPAGEAMTTPSIESSQECAPTGPGIVKVRHRTGEQVS